jgi:hypothetical protein
VFAVSAIIDMQSLVSLDSRTVCRCKTIRYVRPNSSYYSCHSSNCDTVLLRTSEGSLDGKRLSSQGHLLPAYLLKFATNLTCHVSNHRALERLFFYIVCVMLCYTYQNLLSMLLRVEMCMKEFLNKRATS